MNYIVSFMKSIQDYADRVAVVDENGAQSTSYISLDQISGRIADKLMKMGCRPQSAVMICLNRCMEYETAAGGRLGL